MTFHSILPTRDVRNQILSGDEKQNNVLKNINICNVKCETCLK